FSNNVLEAEFRFSFVAGSTVAVEKVALNSEQLFIPLDGQPVTLQATITPINASNKNLNWSSSNPEVATVDENGTVTPVAIGSAEIIVTTEDSNFSANCLVTIDNWIAIEDLTLNKTNLNLGLNEKETLEATITPANASNQKLYWSVDDTNIATVDADGVVTALAPGESTITVSTEDGTITTSCDCIVTDKVVHFPDSELRSRIRQEIRKVSGDIKQSDLMKIKSLNISYAGISSFEGIQYLSNMTSLNLHGIQVSDISWLSSLNNLKNLGLSNNNISNLTPLEKLDNLTSLSLDHNNIKDLTPLEKLNNLTSLYLHGNNISDLTPLEKLSNLTRLYLDSNQIKNLEPLSNLLQLEYLSLASNEIRDITPLVTNINNGGFKINNSNYWGYPEINLRHNYLDINEDSATAEDI
ncbi:MAG TPA: Ig-like domain-containing protein, partial [Syntrophomonadaceae bacterium]|nr:Ig-like domain-containing protein [Syntrophomonadaceae bacterium]